MSNEKIEYLNLDLLHPFENNPFQSVDESEYDELRDSIMEFGIITPLIVNKSDNGYEIISGHRRWQIAKELNLDVVPVYVREFSKEEAVINFVDCNLSREKILPSEKARAYKMKHDAIKKQGARTDLTSSQVGTKFRSDAKLAETMPDSRMQIQRYIRLNNLQPALLDMVDEKRRVPLIGSFFLLLHLFLLLTFLSPLFFFGLLWLGRVVFPLLLCYTHCERGCYYA